jgi:hypothetical protein
MTPSPETLYTTPELQAEELPPETERLLDLECEDGEEEGEDYDDGQPDSYQEHLDFAQDDGPYSFGGYDDF